MPKRSIKTLVLFCIICCTSLLGQEHYVDGVSGPAIDGATFDLEDQYFDCGLASTSPCPHPYEIVSSKLYTKLWFEENIIKQFPNTGWRVTLDYDITLFTPNGNNYPLTRRQKSIVFFDPNNNYQEIDLEIFKPDPAFFGTQPTFYNKAAVTVRDIKVSNLNGSSTPAPPFDRSTLPNFIHFDLELELERVYTYESEVTPRMNVGAFDASTNELSLYWEQIPWADYYDFEFLVLEGDQNYLNAPIEYDFGNATRITTSKNNYRISMAYPESIILFRSRAVGRSRTGPIPLPFRRSEGRWSTSTRGVTNIQSTNYPGSNIRQHQYLLEDENYQNPNFKAYYWAGLEANKNWQYSAVFAEEGKRKEVITFADGLLKETQSATVINTDRNSIINQLVYDWVGRKSIGMLPSPQPSRGIQWYDPLHFNLANETYSYQDFDVTAPGQTPNRPSPLAEVGNLGPGNYYSDQNSQSGGIHHDYIPDAGGYPFQRTIFSNDGTGRVKEQSGIGKSGFFDGGSSGDEMQHSTKYYYDRPDWEVLLMLFGNNVGFADYYERTIKLDPNGQASAVYTDLSGRVIATSLVNDEPDNLLPIDTKPNSYSSITANLHGPTANQIIDGALVINNTFTAYGGRYDFKYRLPATIFTNCVTGDCKYDLQIVLLDEYGNKVPLNLNGSTVDSISFLAIGSSSVDFWANLKLGTYQIVKTLRPNEAAVDQLVEDFINFNLDENNAAACLRPQYIPPIDCELNCQSVCESAHYGTLNDQGIRMITDEDGNVIGERRGITDTFYNPLNPANQRVLDYIRTCQDSCQNFDYADPNNYPDECDIKYDLLRQDMSPAGQYFDNLPNLGTSGYDQNRWLIDSIDAIELVCIQKCIGYTQEGDADYFWNYLRTNWQDAWGDVLIQYHPEYCAFQKRCCASGCSEEDNTCIPTTFKYQSCDRAITQDQKDSIDLLIQNTKNDPQHNFNVQSANAIAALPDSTLAPLFSPAALEAKARAFYEEFYKYKSVQGSCPGLYIVGDTLYGSTYDGFRIRYPANSLFDNFDPSDPDASRDAMQASNCEQLARIQTDRFMQSFNCADQLTAAQLQQLEQDIYNEALANCGQNGTARDLSDAIDQICCGLGLPKSCYASALPEPLAGSCECEEVFQFIFEAVAWDSTLNLPYDLYSNPGLASRPDVQTALNDFLIDQSLRSEFAIWLSNCQTLANWYGSNDPLTYPIDSSFNCVSDEDLLADETSLDECGSQKTEYFRQQERIRFEREVRDSAANLRAHYISYCLDTASAREIFTRTYLLKEYHWALYYYDQAGNFIKNIPPAGIYQEDTGHNSLLDASEIQDAKDYALGTSSAFVRPDHVMYTNYRHNSLNTLTTRLLPDHGDPNNPSSQLTTFFYDAMNRLTLSQNPYQNVKGEYSYLVYDDRGRTTEAGVMQNGSITQDDVTNLDHLHDPSNPDRYGLWFATGNKLEYVLTQYDEKAATSNLIYDQQQVRNRIASVANHANGQSQPTYVTHYSYDALGNVTDLWQENPDLDRAVITTGPQTIDHQFKHFKYDFNLVSGKVKAVHYQAGFADYMGHKYLYDGDNRLTHTFTTTNGTIWNNDATYFYYAHGPLARVEIGQNKVFSEDLVYGINGWLVAKNASSLNPGRDAGRDGLAGGINEDIGLDPFAFSLHYFQKAYRPIGGSAVNLLAKLGHSEQGEAFDNLYDGNIPNFVMGMRDMDLQPLSLMAYGYKYDQLGRFKEQRPIWDKTSNGPGSTNAFSNSNASNQGGDFNVSTEFDGNGNLMSLVRNGIDNYLDMDKLSYNYDLFGTVRKNNQLITLNDNAPTNSYPLDLEGTQDYRYDELGRLVTDPTENIAQIEWNASSKVKRITKSIDPVLSQNVDLEFKYGGLGMRVVKTLKTKDNAGNYLPLPNHENTWYVLDAQGNPIAIYEYRMASSGAKTLILKEFVLYGGSRLGTKTINLKLYGR